MNATVYTYQGRVVPVIAQPDNSLLVKIGDIFVTINKTQKVKRTPKLRLV